MVDVANSSRLGSSERIRDKMTRLQKETLRRQSGARARVQSTDHEESHSVARGE